MTAKKVLSKTAFLELVESIQQHTYYLPRESKTGDAHHHHFAIAQEASPKFYLMGGTRITKLVGEALERNYPGLDSDDREAFCAAVPAYLEMPCIMLRYIEDKHQRDHFLQKVLTTEETALLDSSITRSTNIRNIYGVFKAVFIEDEFPEFTSTLSKLYSKQLRQTHDDAKVLNAKNIRKIVHDFCIKLIKE